MQKTTTKSVILISLMSILILYLIALPSAIAKEQVVVKDIAASVAGDNIEFKLEVENIASDYIKVIPEIRIDRDSKKISEKLLDQYILLPNRTNIITFFYSRSFFSSGEYDISANLRYDKETSNTLLKSMEISDSGEITITSKTEVISPESSYFPTEDSENTLLYVIILVLVLGLMAPRLVSLINALKSKKSEGYDDDSRSEDSGERQETLSRVPKNPARDSESVDDESSSDETYNDEPDEDREPIEEPVESKLLRHADTHGKDLNQAVAEEKNRLKEELDDLDRLYEKEILDDDIYLKNKKAIEDKLSRISVESVMKSNHVVPEVKKEVSKVVSKKLNERKKKLENSLNMLEKLYADQLIDDATFEKNKSEIESAMKKLDEV